MKQFTPILFLVIMLGLVAAAVYYLSRRFALFFPAPGMKSWVWIFSLGLVFAFIGSIGFSELTNRFVAAWSLVGSILLGTFIFLLLSIAVTNLLLTGHTHAGQMFPFTLIAKWMFGYNKGLYRYDEMQIYVSQGLGTFFSPIRFGTHSEITLLRLIPG